ncbi:MAG: DUF3048 domain-containing protein [Candidatus Dormiibacterota bacterium]
MLALLVLSACGNGAKATSSANSPSPDPSPSPPPPPPTPGPLDFPIPNPQGGPLPGQGAAVSGPLAYPLLVQIENTADSRPQAGIEAGSVLFEYITEGGITRFSVLFHHVPGVVGPVRSARFVSVYLYHRFDALLMASGGSKWTYDKIFADPGLPALINDFDHGVHFFRWGGRVAPHNLYTSQAQLLSAAGAGARPPNGGDFPRSNDWAGTEPAGSVTVPEVRTSLTYNGTTYDAVSDGQAQTDVVFGKVQPRSVVVMRVRQWITNLTEDVTGGTARDFDLNSGGVADMYAKGTVIHGHWASPADNKPIALTDAAGAAVSMPPGLVWVILQP